ncbi:19900_t:CDS:2, partial [Gigaspora margarita]
SNGKILKKVKIDDYFYVRNSTLQHEQEQVNQIRTSRETSPPSMATTTSMHSLYVPSSPSSTISEECTIAGKRTYLLSYFTGPGVPEWNLNEDSVRWIVNDVDISEICLEYREEVVKKCEPMTVTLDAFEELALSHVFIFHEESPYGLCEYFDSELWEDLFVEFQKTYPYSSIPDNIYDLYTSIIRISCEKQNCRERQEVAKRHLKNYGDTNEEEKILVEIFKNLFDNEKFSLMRNNTIEDTHIIQNVIPIIMPFFNNNRKIIFEGANKMSESSAIAQKRFDPILLGTKPDFVVKTTNPKKQIELLISEIKPPNKGDAFVSDDLVSLGKTMKCAIDKSIEDGIDDLVICGLQIIGFLGRSYVIDLRYDGIYRMILIGEFELPRSTGSWGILKCYQILNTIR